MHHRASDDGPAGTSHGHGQRTDEERLALIRHPHGARRGHPRQVDDGDLGDGDHRCGDP